MKGANPCGKTHRSLNSLSLSFHSPQAHALISCVVTCYITIQLVSLNQISEKAKEPYADVISVIRTKISSKLHPLLQRVLIVAKKEATTYSSSTSVPEGG